MKKPFGLRDDVTVRSIAEKSNAYFFLIVFIAVLPAFLEGFDGNLFGFASPYIVENAHASVASLGLLITGSAIGLTLFSLAGGFLFDKFSVKNTILISVSIFSVFTFLSGFSHNLTMLMIARILDGIGVGMFQPAIVAFLGDIFPEKRGKATAAFAISYGAGIFVAPFVVSPFLPNITIPFAIVGILSALSVLGCYLFIPKTYKRLEKQKVEFKGVLNRNVNLISLSTLFYGVAQFAFIGFISQYLLKVLHLPPGQAAMISSIYGISGLICSMPLGMLADRIGRKHVFRLTGLLLFIGGAGIFSVGSHVLALSILMFVFGAGSYFPGIASAIGQDSVKEHVTGTVTGYIFFIFGIGQIFGGPLFSFLLPLGFMKAGLIALGVPSLLCFLLTLFTNSGMQRALQTEKDSLDYNSLTNTQIGVEKID